MRAQARVALTFDQNKAPVSRPGSTSKQTPLRQEPHVEECIDGPVHFDAARQHYAVGRRLTFSVTRPCDLACGLTVSLTCGLTLSLTLILTLILTLSLTLILTSQRYEPFAVLWSPCSR
jgi:hypothetical protein